MRRFPSLVVLSHSLLLGLTLLLPVPAAGADPPGCPPDPSREALLTQAREAATHVQNPVAVVEAYSAIDLACLPDGDLFELAAAAESIGRGRLALRAYQRWADQKPEQRRVLFKEKDRILRLAPTSEVTLRVDPPGTTVELDGGVLGTAPASGETMTFTVAGGPHKLSLSGPGLSRQDLPFEAGFGEPLALAIHMSPVPMPRVPLPEPEASDDNAAARPCGPTSGAFLGLLAGLALPDYGTSSLDTGLAFQGGLEGGYLFRLLPWLGLSLLGSAQVTPIHDAAEDLDAAFLMLLGGAGLRISPLWPAGLELFAEVRFEVGASLLVGAEPGLFLFPEDAKEVSSVFTTLALRPSLLLGLTLGSGLAFLLQPLAVDVQPRHSDFHPAITQILRYHFSLGIAYYF